MSGLTASIHLTRPSGFEVDAGFAAEPGATVALLGPNGAGKSTIVWALAGTERLDSGRIELDGRVLDDPAAGVFVPPEERRVAAVFQDGLLFPHLTVLQNVSFAAQSASGSHRRALEAAAGWLDRLNLTDLGPRRPRELSGGQAQRVGLARALAAEPRMLLLDEPLSALDVSARLRVRRMLTEHLAEFEGPRILVTHDPAEAALLADRVVLVEDGRVTQEGSPDQILRQPRTEYAADLAGLNLVRGRADRGEVSTGGPVIVVADTEASGEVLLTIHPRTISVYPGRPEGSPRNTWQTAAKTGL